jgi:AcrR family transcriptional regulator
MTRTIKEPSIRKNELLDIAQKLFFEKGYDSTSIADILDAAEASKGAFYHYFESKEELLDCLIDRMTHHIIEHIEEIVADPTMPAIRKAHAYFEITRSHQAENRELVFAYIKVLYGNSNYLMLKKGRLHMKRHLQPLLQEIVNQGIREGVFNPRFPDRCIELIFALAFGMDELDAEAILGLEKNPENLRRLIENAMILQEICENILGAPPGTLTIADQDFITLMSGKTTVL